MSSAVSDSLHTASLTDTGSVRAVNQDACQEFGRSDGWQLLVVADGMGGHAGGERASHLALEAIGQVFAAGSEDAEALLREAYEAANAHILAEAASDPQLDGMGTTAVSLLIHAGGAVTANVGDSRAYRLRAHRMEALTEDHSWVQTEVRKGRLSPEEAKTHPYRNRLVRCLGYDPGVMVDVRAVNLEPGDTFLLCSDGLWGELAESEIVRILEAKDLQQAVKTLVESADQNGGRDNITAVVARLGESSVSESRRAGEGRSENAILRWFRGLRRRA